ncbi:MAG: D-glycero-beta-D-manno-heptose-7-phosphate kinase [Candidatus Riflebacteria bacterium]|nr:D-glycero-beta-D-manno-heptose-7-phosphate kinase [Candidatus Riflebacteria bacterium]
MINRDRLKEILSSFHNYEIAVLGDLMLDEYLWGKVDRISPEAPVPVVQVKRETWLPGGAANVAMNIVALGGKTCIFGVTGDDGTGRKLKESLLEKKINTQGMIIDSGRCTTLKTRIIGHNQQMVRIDRETSENLEQKTARSLTEVLSKMIPSVSGVIVSDYAKGVITLESLPPMIEKFRKNGKFVSVDPKLKNYPLYAGSTIITPNTKEAESILGRLFESQDDVESGGTEILKRFKIDAVLITRGENGMSLFEKNKHSLTIPTRAIEVFDVTGAGDTVIATFSLALATGCSMSEAAEVANLAAGVVVGIIGTATASPKSILDHYDKINMVEKQ